MNQPQEQLSQELNKSIDIQRVLLIIWNRWYVIAGSILISLTVAYIQLRYTKPLYTASATMKFEDERGSQVSDLFKYGRISGRIENIIKTETEVLRSRTMALKTLRHMQLYTSVYVKGNFITSELYPNRAFSVILADLDSADVGRSFAIQVNNDLSFSLLPNTSNQKYFFGDTLTIGGSRIVLTSNLDEHIKILKEQPITITINDLQTMASWVAKGLEVSIEKNANIISLSYTSEIAEFASDYVNAVAQVYSDESVNNRTSAAKQTIAYIDQQLEELAKSVSASQQNLASFKSNNKGVEPKDLGRAEFSKLLELETQKNIFGLRKKQLRQLEKDVILSQNNPIELLIIDAEDANAVSELVALLNKNILERLSFAGKYSKESPVMKDNEQKSTEIKAAISRAIRVVENSLNAQIENNNSQIQKITSSLADLPAKEQDLFNLERTFKINEKIYGYLQEKRLENLIGISSIIPNVSVIDEALLSTVPISPKPAKNYSFAFLIGLTLGVGSIFGTRLLYNKIPDKETIESMSRIPVIGVIKKVEEEQKEGDYGIYVYKNPKSVFAESIRGIRTNINFILKGEKNKIICITSSVSGEGKTFCTVNIAASFTQLGHKVVIVGCDLRRPKLHESFDAITNKNGLTSYLVNRAHLDDIIFETGYENLSIVPAGPTPPNPSELLQTKAFDHFLTELAKRFDYVFLDTAPVGLVSDSLNLMTKSDINLFVLRAQYSKREFATTPDRLASENNISQIYSILNSFDHAAVVYSSLYKREYGDYLGGSGYYYYGGYYYGKGYGNSKSYNSYYAGYYADEDIKHKQKSFWQKLFTNSSKS